MKRTALLVLAGLALVWLGCSEPKQELMLRAPALVIKGGAPDAGRPVAFTADKYYDNGDMASDSRLTAGKIADAYGYADFLFGYKLEYDDVSNLFTGFARVIATVTYNGTEYADTVWMPSKSVNVEVAEYLLDTLRINLPAR